MFKKEERKSISQTLDSLKTLCDKIEQRLQHARRRKQKKQELTEKCGNLRVRCFSGRTCQRPVEFDLASIVARDFNVIRIPINLPSSFL
jgi:hypothetical protein